MPATSVTGVIDTDFAPYRDFYTRRVQRLERFKKARSFCCVVGDDEPGLAPVPLPPLPTSPPAAANPTTLDAKFNELRQKMISLMENDVTLMRQLLALGETIEGLKAESSRSRRSSLASSLSDEDEAVDLEMEQETVSGTITQLLVNEDPSPYPLRKQYFSRKNSVLRIPIPPCHKLHHHRSLRSPAANSCNSTDDDVSSGVSSVSSRRSEDNPNSQQQQETRDKLSPLFSPTGSFSSARRITPSARKGHDSNVSIDSGIRLSSPPHSPSHSDSDENCVKEEDEVLV